MNAKSFQGYDLSIEIKRALSALHYVKPTEVQSEVIPIALKQKDLVVKSQTGSGKTAAFGIPLCEMVHWIQNKPQALVLTPTRELAVQVKEDLMNIGRFKRIKVAAIYGKQSFTKQQLELKQKNHIVVGTPGRVLDHIKKGTISLEDLKFLVIDEADEMLSMGFIDQVEQIIQSLPIERMTMLFSATFPEDVEELCQRYMHDPTKIEMKPNTLVANKVKHVQIDISEDDKLLLLKWITIIENPDSCIIFCNTQQNVDFILNKLNTWGYDCDKIHGGMYQEDRFAVMDDFRRGAFRYLVATDVAARGIDIENITHVINYDLPKEKESYVHRTGRTGRAGHMGRAITFVTPYDEEKMKEIERFVGHDIQKTKAPTKEAVENAKDAFEAKLQTNPVMKKDKSEQLNKDIMKLYFNGGKKKKLRAVDFVGTISKIPGIKAEDVGIITIQDTCTYVDILNGKGSIVLQEMKNTTVKGKLLKVHKARK
ncbi:MULTISPECIES: DEAD/DEAH box helicase [Bacillus]|uniref:DEAD/DEAH box helicase n=1 Tax=Bacillus TaxID=1386 RepID=UPI0002F08F88|nr:MULTISPECIES: DEAD/DEAH box helicase [Bacillus]